MERIKTINLFCMPVATTRSVHNLVCGIMLGKSITWNIMLFWYEYHLFLYVKYHCMGVVAKNL